MTDSRFSYELLTTHFGAIILIEDKCQPHTKSVTNDIEAVTNHMGPIIQEEFEQHKRIPLLAYKDSVGDWTGILYSLKSKRFLAYLPLEQPNPRMDDGELAIFLFGQVCCAIAKHKCIKKTIH